MSIAKNTILNIASATIPLIIALITIPKYLDIIGAEKYGIIAIILTIQSYFSFMDLGLGKSVTKEISNSDAKNFQWQSRVYWTASIAIAIISGIAAAIIILLISTSYRINLFEIKNRITRETLDAIQIAIICIPPLLLSSVNIGALQAKQMFAKISIVQTSGSILAQTAPLIIAHNNITDLRILILSTLGARIISLLWLIFICKREFARHHKIIFEYEIFKRLISYGGWLSLINLLSPLLTIIDRSIIGIMKGPAAVSAYTIPYDIVSRSMIISSSFSSALFPKLAAQKNNNGEEIAIKASKVLNLTATTVTIILIATFDTFLKYWISNDNYTNSKGIGEILLLGVWINSLVIPFHTNFISKNNPKTIFLVFATEIPIYLVLLYIGTSILGPLGAACAWTARVFIDTIILLKINKALNHNLKSIKLSISFIAISFTITAFLENPLIILIYANITALLYIIIEIITNKYLRDIVSNHLRKVRIK